MVVRRYNDLWVATEIFSYQGNLARNDIASGPATLLSFNATSGSGVSMQLDFYNDTDTLTSENQVFSLICPTLTSKFLSWFPTGIYFSTGISVDTGTNNSRWTATFLRDV